MSNENVNGLMIIVLTVLGYTYYVFPYIHTMFNPITFWQKLAMFFTIDITTLVLTLILSAIVVGGLNKIYEILIKV